MLGRRLGLADGALDLAVTLVEKHSRENGQNKKSDQGAEFHKAVTAERVRVSAIDASVGLRVGKAACVALWHGENSTKTFESRRRQAASSTGQSAQLSDKPGFAHCKRCAIHTLEQRGSLQSHAL